MSIKWCLLHSEMRTQNWEYSYLHCSDNGSKSDQTQKHQKFHQKSSIGAPSTQPFEFELRVVDKSYKYT